MDTSNAVWICWISQNSLRSDKPSIDCVSQNSLRWQRHSVSLVNDECVLQQWNEWRMHWFIQFLPIICQITYVIPCNRNRFGIEICSLCCRTLMCAVRLLHDCLSRKRELSVGNDSICCRKWNPHKYRRMNCTAKKNGTVLFNFYLSICEVNWDHRKNIKRYDQNLKSQLSSTDVSITNSFDIMPITNDQFIHIIHSSEIRNVSVSDIHLYEGHIIWLDRI